MIWSQPCIMAIWRILTFQSEYCTLISNIKLRKWNIPMWNTKIQLFPRKKYSRYTHNLITKMQLTFFTVLWLQAFTISIFLWSINCQIKIYFLHSYIPEENKYYSILVLMVLWDIFFFNVMLGKSECVWAIKEYVLRGSFNYSCYVLLSIAWNVVKF